MSKRPRSSLEEIDVGLKKQANKIQNDKKKVRKQRAQSIQVKAHRGKQDYSLTDVLIEDNMIDALDFRKEFGQMKVLMDKLVEDKYDPTTYFQKISKFAAAQLASVAFTGEKEKNRLDALKHLLALGGHTATQKHEISGRVDPETPKAALMSMIRGSSKELAEEGIEIVDDSQDYDK